MIDFQKAIPYLKRNWPDLLIISALILVVLLIVGTLLTGNGGTQAKEYLLEDGTRCVRIARSVDCDFK